MQAFPRSQIFAALCFVTLPLLSCGGSGSGPTSIVNPPPVQAQTYAYSSASLSGTYTLSMIEGEPGIIVTPVTFIGSMVFDGAGNITSGTITEAATTYGGATVNCPITATGKYTLGSDATGTATVTLAGTTVSSSANSNSPAVNGCYPVPPQIPLSIAAAQQGQVFVFQMATGTTNVNFSGLAFKQ
jgi:hypothetical protein